mgnify:CR=1 FL=1
MEHALRVAAYCRVSTDSEDQLHSLEAQGWVTSSDGVANGRTRRYYAITRDGRVALAEQQAGWYAYADAVRGVLEGGNPCGA